MKVEITPNELVDRLRTVQSKLTEQNEHSDALFVGFAIQAITASEAARLKIEYPLRFVSGVGRSVDPPIA